MPINDKEAKDISKKQIHLLQSDDPLFEQLKNAIAEQPILVKNVFRSPSYWIVPLLKESQMVGFVRVLLNGKVAHIGIYNKPGKLGRSPAFITQVESTEASKLASKRIREDIGESGSEPVFVHDGPIGKEAWLVEVSKDGKPNRWIFVSGNSIYERCAGEILHDTE
jgi:hypothetical protein